MFAKGIDERTLKSKLANIPEREMLDYHTQRMKQYRVYFIIALACGIVSGISFFVFPDLTWISGIFAVLGIIILGWGSYERKRWKQLFENLLYLKRHQQTQQDEHSDQDKRYSNKYDRLKKEI